MTYHSIIRTEQRAKVNEEAAIRMINRAKARGKRACQLKCVSFLFPLFFEGCSVDGTD